MKQASAPSSPFVLAYLSLRRAVGYLGVFFPLVLLVGAYWFFNTGMQPSISSYYHTGMRDVFVGILFAIGIFLFSYKGYESKDDLVGNLACAFAIGVALFPTTPAVDPSATQKIIGALHLTFAALFFLTLAYFSLFLFTKTASSKPPSPRKMHRNKIYRICGYTIVASIFCVFLLTVLPQAAQQKLREYNPVFLLESLAVVAFGFSWLIKGETILQDK